MQPRPTLKWNEIKKQENISQFGKYRLVFWVSRKKCNMSMVIK